MGRNGELDLMGKSKNQPFVLLIPWETKRRGKTEFEMKAYEREPKKKRKKERRVRQRNK